MLVLSVTLFNQSAEEIHLKSQAPLIKFTSVNDIQGQVKGMRLPWDKSRPMIEGAYKVCVSASTEDFEELYADYLTSVQVNAIRAAGAEGLEEAEPEVVDKVRKFAKKWMGASENTKEWTANVRTKNDVERSQLALSLLLFNHHIRSKGDEVSLKDMKALQNSDPELIKIIEQVKNEKSPELVTKYRVTRYELQKEILYRVVEQKKNKFPFVYRVLCIPKFLSYQIAVNLHNRNTHLNAKDMCALIQKAFWSHKMEEMCQKAREQCLICFYAFQPKKRHSTGQVRLHEREQWQVGKILEVDLLFLSYDHDIRSQACLCACDPVSNYFIALPINSKKENSILRALATLFSTQGAPKYLKSDKGSEWLSAGVQDFLTSLNIGSYFGTSKNSTSSVEIMIKQFKTILLELLQKYHLPNNRWGRIFVVANILLQNRPCRKGSFLTRYQVNFSPLRYVNPMFRLVDWGDNDVMLALHKSHYLYDGGKNIRLKKRQGVINPGIEEGALVKNEIPRGEQISQNNSQQLLPSTTKIMRVLKPLGDKQAALCQDLLAGSENVFPATELRPIHFNDLPISQEILAKNIENFVENTNTKQFARKIFSTPDPSCFMVQIRDYGVMTFKEPGKPILKKQTQMPLPPYKGALIKSVKGRAELQAYEDAAFLSGQLNLPIPQRTTKLLSQADRYGEVRELCRVPSVERFKASHNRKCRFQLPSDHQDTESKVAMVLTMSFDSWDEVLCPSNVW